MKPNDAFFTRVTQHLGHGTMVSVLNAYEDTESAVITQLQTTSPATPSQDAPDGTSASAIEPELHAGRPPRPSSSIDKPKLDVEIYSPSCAQLPRSTVEPKLVAQNAPVSPTGTTNHAQGTSKTARESRGDPFLNDVDSPIRTQR